MHFPVCSQRQGLKSAAWLSHLAAAGCLLLSQTVCSAGGPQGRRGTWVITGAPCLTAEETRVQRDTVAYVRSCGRWAAEAEPKLRSRACIFTAEPGHGALGNSLWSGGEVGSWCQRCERQRKRAFGVASDSKMGLSLCEVTETQCHSDTRYGIIWALLTILA